jgi:hypothetical protein
MFYANKKKREELSALSKEVFGTRGRWYKFVQKRGYTLEQIEEQMLKLKGLIDAQKEELKRRQVRPEQTDDVPNSSGSST